MLTLLEATLTTTTTVSTSDLLQSTMNGSADLTMSIDGFVYALCLPSLISLKATLDNATFCLTHLSIHLSILSADFSYAGAGFHHFFEVHGAKLLQLELGHSSGNIEKAWLTDPPRATGPVDPQEGFPHPPRCMVPCAERIHLQRGCRMELTDTRVDRASRSAPFSLWREAHRRPRDGEAALQ